MLWCMTPARFKWPQPITGIVIALTVIGIGAYFTGGPTETPKSDGLVVSQSDLGWPLNIPGGVLKCSGNAVTLTTDQKTVYALNGNARGQAENNGWRDSQPFISGDIGPLIAKGLTLCQM